MKLGTRLNRPARAGVLTVVLLLAPGAARAAASSISISPGSGAPGTSILVDGSGFAALHTLAFAIDGVTLATSPSPASTDLAGNFQQVTFAVPAGEPAGGHTVTVSDGTNPPASKPLTVPAPTAAFTPDSADVLPGTVIQFDATPTSDPGNSITGYGWDFGDGSTANGARPTHAYGKAGTYTVRLTITDSSGNTAAVSHQVTVAAPPPVQTLIEMIAPAPSVIASGAPSMTNSGRFDLGQRVFCPGDGPSCTSSITVTRGLNSQIRRAGASSVVSTVQFGTPANGSTEVAFRLSRAAFKSYRAHKPVPLTVVIASRRGAEETITKLNLILKKRR